MNAFCKSLYSWRRAARLATFVIVLAACVVAAHAQTQETASQQPPTGTPEALFQDSTLTGTTNTINVNWLPVANTTMGTIYDDVTIQFAVAADGTLTVASVQIAPSPRVIIDHFKAGNYIGPSNDTNFLITVSGPGIAPGGVTEWSLAASPGASGYTYPSEATWWCGPIKNSPYWKRIKAAGVPLQGFCYGVGSGYDSNYNWGTDSLLGFSQNGDDLTISSFTHLGTDQPEPVDNIPYTYCTGKNGCKQNK